jgi:putative chitinase
MDMTTFFDRLRPTIFGGSIPQSAVDSSNIIIEYWNTSFPDGDEASDARLAYVLATVVAEVGRNMRPVRETFASSDAQARARLSHKSYAQSVPPHGHAYYGRGFVQLTWLSNYRRQENKLGVPLVEYPDLALRTDIALQVLVNGMMAGDFNASGRGLEYYVNANGYDFVNARRTVNILDRATEIAGYANSFLDAIVSASEATYRTTTFFARRVDFKMEEEGLVLPSPDHMQAQRDGGKFSES